MHKSAILFLLVGLLLVASCSPAPSGQELVGTSWALVGLDGNAQFGEIIGGQSVALAFTGSTEAGGSGGCNSFGATYSANSSTGSIAFSDLVSTLIACVNGNIGEFETAYFAALNAADHYGVSGSTLTITGNGHVLIFELSA